MKGVGIGLDRIRAHLGIPMPEWRRMYPATYWAWRARAMCPATPQLPDGWHDRLDHLASEDQEAVAVVVHVHYPALLPGIVSRLGHIPVPFNLFITNSSEVDLAAAFSLPSNANNMIVLPILNRGRDMLPFVHLINSGVLDDAPVVLKVHTKMSAWRANHSQLEGDGSQWRESLLDALVGDQASVEKILQQFANNPEIAIVAPNGNVLGEDFWGSNLPALARLASRVDLRFAASDLKFAAGSMYWVRGSYLKLVKDLGLRSTDFEDEAGQIDGTTAHALERFLGLWAVRRGLQIEEVGKLKT